MIYKKDYFVEYNIDQIKFKCNGTKETNATCTCRK